eukprot:CAMPEP_0182485474 /NCGR_PEP_ID=MMETSP1319-20130603/45321_1 /TAXON_ID=172717 /ORGANISM="Bolidomonas pacifica, Strain RCC208" /LENGTH=443 /DNA_ID=CAMNT_0024687459 /DNA_START=101 /DNA_END=1429 /DNA_ORIENTATION=+
MVIYSLPSFGNPADGLSVANTLSFMAADLIAGVGLCEIILQAMHVQSSLKLCLIYAVSFMIPHILTCITLANTWKWPVPYGYLWFATSGVIVANCVLFYKIFGKEFFTRSEYFRHTWPNILIAMLTLLFVICFAFYRSLFISVGESRQIFLSPVWSGIKWAFTGGVKRLIVLGQNPDMAPYLLFIFDALAALCGNFLFMDADGPLVVAAIILLNVVENFLMSVKVVSLMSKSKRMASERKLRKEAEDLGKVEALLQSHEQKIYELEYELEKIKNKDKGVTTSAHRRSSRIVHLRDRTESEKHVLLHKGLQRRQPDGSMKDMSEGQEVVYMHQALNIIISYCASEIAEIMCGFWACVIIPMMYYSPNHDYYYSIEDLSWDDFVMTMKYSSFDVVAGACCFGLTLTFLHTCTELSSLYAVFSYVSKKRLFLPLLAASCLVTFASW